MEGRDHNNQDIACYICAELMMGRSLTSICRDKNVPSLPTVYSWLNSSKPYYVEEFFKSYSAAREIQAHVLCDEILEIADDDKHDFYFTRDKQGREVRKVNYDHIKKSELRINARKWYLAHLQPRKYGNKNHLTKANDKPSPHASINLIVDFGGNENE